MSQQRKGCKSCETEFESGAKVCKECRRGKEEFMESVDYQTSRIQRLKRDGNQHFEAGHLDMALVKYTEGMQIGGDNKVLFLNRALVFTKLGRFEEAVEDCTEVLESNEKPLHLKALLRRANAYKNLKNLIKARIDIQAALKMQPNDQDAEKLQKEIDQEIEEDEAQKKESLQMRQVREESGRAIEFYKQGQNDLLPVLQYMRSFPAKSKFSFFTSKCCKILLAQVATPSELNHDENLNVCLPALVLSIYMEDCREHQQDFINNNGIEILIQKIRWLLQQTDRLSSAIYDAVQDYLEVLARFSLKVSFLYPELFNSIMHLHEPSLIETYLNICTNECQGSSELKIVLSNNFSTVIVKLLPLFRTPQEAAACNLLTNLFTLDQCRTEALKNSELITALLDSLSEQAMNCLINLNVTEELTPVIPALIAKIEQGISVDQSVELVSRSTYADHYACKYLVRQYPQCLKIIIQAINNNHTMPEWPDILQLLQSCEIVIRNCNDVHFINACTVIIFILKEGPRATLAGMDSLAEYICTVVEPLKRVNGSKQVREIAQKLYTIITSRVPKHVLHRRLS